MSVQTINIGNIVNDGLGDDLRTAFQKVNANFTELQSALTITASNVGSGFGVFKGKVASDLRFKTLIPSTKMLIEDRTDALIISSTQPDAFTSITTNSGVLEADAELDITIQGGENIRTSAVGSVMTIDTVLDLNQILTTFDFGPITGDYQFSPQFALSCSNIDFGTVDRPGTINLDLGVL
jgi:hypothetical protein